MPRTMCGRIALGLRHNSRSFLGFYHSRCTSTTKPNLLRYHDAWRTCIMTGFSHKVRRERLCGARYVSIERGCRIPFALSHFSTCLCLLEVVGRIHWVAEWSTTDTSIVSESPSAVAPCGTFLPGVVQLFIPSWDGEFACTGPGLRGTLLTLQCDRDHQCEDRVCSVQSWEGEGFRKMVVQVAFSALGSPETRLQCD